MHIMWGITLRRVRTWVLAAATAAGIAQHANAYVLTVDPASQTVNLGSEIGITVTIEDVLPFGLGAYNLDLSFEGSVLQFDRVTDSLGLGGNAFGLSYSLSGNVLSFADTSLDDVDTLLALQSPSFALFTIYFDTVGVGASNLALSNITLADANALEGLYSSSSGSVTVIDAIQPPVPEPSTWMLLAVGLGAVVFITRGRRRRDGVTRAQLPLPLPH